MNISFNIENFSLYFKFFQAKSNVHFFFDLIAVEFVRVEANMSIYQRFPIILYKTTNRLKPPNV